MLKHIRIQELLNKKPKPFMANEFLRKLLSLAKGIALLFSSSFICRKVKVKVKWHTHWEEYILIWSCRIKNPKNRNISRVKEEKLKPFLDRSFRPALL